MIRISDQNTFIIYILQSNKQKNGGLILVKVRMNSVDASYAIEILVYIFYSLKLGSMQTKIRKEECLRTQ
jgi:hypothetical protein